MAMVLRPFPGDVDSEHLMIADSFADKSSHGRLEGVPEFQVAQQEPHLGESCDGQSITLADRVMQVPKLSMVRPSVPQEPQVQGGNRVTYCSKVVSLGESDQEEFDSEANGRSQLDHHRTGEGSQRRPSRPYVHAISTGAHRVPSVRKNDIELSRAEQAISILQKFIHQLSETRLVSVPPRTTAEVVVRNEMAKALGIEESDICCRDSDFFALGGSPETAMRFLKSLRERHELSGPDGQAPSLTMEDLKVGASVSGLATAIAIRNVSLSHTQDRHDYTSFQSHQSHYTSQEAKTESMKEKMSYGGQSSVAQKASCSATASVTNRARSYENRSPQAWTESALAAVRRSVALARARNLAQNRADAKQGPNAAPISSLPEEGKEELVSPSLTGRQDPSQIPNPAPSTPSSHLSPENSRTQTRRLSASGRFRVNSDDVQSSTKRFATVRLPMSVFLFGTSRTRRRRFVLALVESGLFNVLSGIVIFASAICIGIETDFKAREQETSAFEVINLAFDFIFVSEVFIRMFAHGRAFFTNSDSRWNWLDICCVVVGVVGDVVNLLEIQVSEVNAIKALRMIRLVRTLRLLKSLKSVREFQKMLFALVSSSRTLLCSLMILFVVMYFFGVVLCQGVTLYRIGGSAPQAELNELDKLFGSMASTFICLLMSITSGVSWSEVFDALIEVSPVYGTLYLAYITTCLFGVMNVVTSVFVESAIMSAQHYKHLIIQEKAREREREREIAMGHMKQVFKQIDEDSSGEITADEMDLFLKDAGLRKYVEALNINPENARMLFRLLDTHGSKKVDIDEFCEGCLRLQGEANSFDVHKMMYQMKTFLVKWSDFTTFVEACFADLVEAQGRPDLFEEQFMLPEQSCMSAGLPHSEGTAM